MRSTKTLPPSYQSIGTLDITQNQRAFLWLNLIGLGLMFVFGWLFIEAIIWLRSPSLASGLLEVSIHSIPEALILIVEILALTVLYVTAHEAVHGLFFWLFTRSRPVFAFHWTYAYASAPGWYIPRLPFLVTTLAPLVVISLVGLFLFRVIPAAWLLPTWYILMMNAAGAVGDLWVAVWLLRQPETCLAQDKGNAVTLFLPYSQ